ncbi:hypothetical protein [uncultured Microbacterium sp.]|uniref:hypothetical protein n=1 Tax=uncultured Microbacterium sp. TaxID=191216 RepID=UPI0028D4FDCD|nr:hypothetical protein [uncultured Microbacterium sp.]
MDAIDASNDTQGNAIQANAKYQTALAGISDEVDRQKEAYIQLQRDAYEASNGTLDGFVGTLDGFTLSLDRNTEAGAVNAAGLEEVSAAARDSAQAQFEVDLKTMSAKEATDKYMETLAAQRQAFIDSAVQAGYNRDEVGKLADEIFTLPSEKEVALTVDAQPARDAINGFITDYQGREITLKIGADGQQTYSRDGGRTTYEANGDIVEFMARGGVRGLRPMSPIAKVVPPNTWRVVGDRGDVPEAYIPLDGSVRSMAILGEAMQRMGVMGMAAGGIMQPQYASNQPRFSSGASATAGGFNNVQNIYPAQGMSEEQIARIATERFAFAARGN